MLSWLAKKLEVGSWQLAGLLLKVRDLVVSLKVEAFICCAAIELYLWIVQPSGVIRLVAYVEYGCNFIFWLDAVVESVSVQREKRAVSV